MQRVVGCQMQDEAGALVPYWWIKPGKLQLIVGSIHGLSPPKTPIITPIYEVMVHWRFYGSMQMFPS